jgi:hypothetical protein
MAAKAKYVLQVPTHDNQGNELTDLAAWGGQQLRAAGIQGGRIEGPVRGFWEDEPEETFWLLIVHHEESPEMDSHVTATAKRIAELASQWATYAWKEPVDGGIVELTGENPNYSDGDAAHPVVQRQAALSERLEAAVALWEDEGGAFS